MTDCIVPVILSGGSGTRLWPLSTPDKPKQFHAVLGDRSLFRQTIERVADRTCFTAPVVVCGARHVALVEGDLKDAGILDATILVEPAARNTAPAIALAALLCPPDSALLVMPSDHVMTDPAAMLAAVEVARTAVMATGAIATFGIAPDAPETGYGYIRRAEPIDAFPGVHRIGAFVEKPDRDSAVAMLAAGGHHWNAGIFLMRADALLSELTRQQPAIASACAGAMAQALRTGRHVVPDAAAFADCPALSIDYAVMEAADNAIVVPVDPGWSDVGSWAALLAIASRDVDGNAVSGPVITIDSRNNLIRSDGDMRVATVGINDCVIIVHGTDILIMPRDRAQSVKDIVDRITSGG